MTVQGAHAQSIVKWARYYADMGMIPVPMHGITQDRAGVIKCSCASGSLCEDPGKRPYRNKGEKDLTSPEEGFARVVAQAIKDPNLNLAVLTGASGLLVVDLDTKDSNGDPIDGLENFIAMVGDKPFPEAPHQHTGGGGHHFVFQIPIDSTIKARQFGKGIEFKTGSGNNFNVKPSRHKSGKPYTWDPPPSFKLMPPPCPDWILDLARESGTRGFKRDQILTVAAEELKKLDKKWRASSNVGTSRNGRALAALVAYDPQKPPTQARILEVLPEGSRLNLLQLAGALAAVYPRVRPSCVLEQLKPAIDWRVGKGHSTSYADIEKMLDEQQAKIEAELRSWHGKLLKNKEGTQPLACLSNAYSILRNHPDWNDVLAFNERDGCPTYLKKPPFPTTETEYPRPIAESDCILIVNWFAESCNVAMGKATVQDALVAACKERLLYDSVKKYFDDLPPWDGVPRLDQWLHNYAGAEDNTYTQRVGAAYLISAVARTYTPGCKVDHVLVFEGDQGFKKSTLIKTLCADPSWFSDTHINIENKDGYIQLSGKLFVEFSELASIRRSTKEHTKNYITNASDNFRKPFDRTNSYVPRRSVFAASTNEPYYLVDETGNRRYWPVKCGATEEARISALVEDRDQLWAETVHRYKTPPEDAAHLCEATGGEIWWLTRDEEELAKVEQDKRLEVHEHPWMDFIHELLTNADRREEFPTADFAQVDIGVSRLIVVNDFFYAQNVYAALKIAAERNDSGKTRRVAQILRLLGCTPKRDGAGVRRGWVLPPEMRLTPGPTNEGGESDSIGSPVVPIVRRAASDR